MDDDSKYKALCANTRELLKTRQGKDFIWYVLDRANLYSDVFTGDNQTFYLEGRRSVGLAVLQLLEDIDPTAYPRLLLDRNKSKEIENG
jgi:hypothetical protein